MSDRIRHLEEERDDLRVDVGHHQMQIRQLMAERAGLVEENKLARKLIDRLRPWLFEPGDRVLCLYSEGSALKLLAGRVDAVQIPGPVHPDRVVLVVLDDDMDTGVGLAWWSPDQLERLGG